MHDTWDPKRTSQDEPSYCWCWECTSVCGLCIFFPCLSREHIIFVKTIWWVPPTLEKLYQVGALVIWLRWESIIKWSWKYHIITCDAPHLHLEREMDKWMVLEFLDFSVAHVEMMRFICRFSSFSLQGYISKSLFLLVRFWFFFIHVSVLFYSAFKINIYEGYWVKHAFLLIIVILHYAFLHMALSFTNRRWHVHVHYFL